jgi:hypothetical protein
LPFAHAIRASLFVVVLATPLFGAEPGKATGTVTIDGTTTAMTLAVSSESENLFDDKKKDTMVTVVDRALGDAEAGDDVSLSMRARTGEIVVVMLRMDGAKLTNVSVMYKGLSGVIKLPGQWFTFTSSGKTSGTLKLAKKEFDGHSYACDLTFSGAPASKQPAAVPAAPPKAAPSAAPRPEALPPASTLNIEPKAATAMFVGAMMQKDERQALGLVKAGIDPNSRDKDGIPILNWSVMMCMPSVVQALIDRHADLKYQRAPGLTIMQEAGACPAAAKILSAAGAK